MMVRFVILLSTLCSALAIPRASNQRQLQDLIRLPAIQFAPILDFDRRAGFLLFPVSDSLAEKAARLEKEATDPSKAEKALEAGKLLEEARNEVAAFRQFSRAVNLYRQKLELNPNDAKVMFGLADALCAVGNFEEASTLISRALQSGNESNDYFRAMGRFHRDRAWRLTAGDENLYRGLSLIEVLNRVTRRGIPSEQAGEIRKELRLAREAFDKASQTKAGDEDGRREKAAFISFGSAIEKALDLMQSDETFNVRRELGASLFSHDALEELRGLAKLRDQDPEVLGVAAMAGFFATTYDRHIDFVSHSGRNWELLQDSEQGRIRECLNRLAALSESANAKTASSASEAMACLQYFLLADEAGCKRNLRKSLGYDPTRKRSWDLLILTLGSGDDPKALVAACEDRASKESTVRNQLLLAKACDRAGEELEAQLSALGALSLDSNDFQANLTFALLLMKREDFAGFTARVQEALNRAERKGGVSSSRQNFYDLAMAKALYYALTDDEEKARAAMNGLSPAERSRPEARDLSQLIGY
jgi:hypothetical protein